MEVVEERDAEASVRKEQVRLLTCFTCHVLGSVRGCVRLR